jgi:hypothetical protein
VPSSRDAAAGPIPTAAAVEQALMRRLGWSQQRLRLVVAAAVAVVLALMVIVPQVTKTDCDRLGDLIVSLRGASMNQEDDHAAEFSDLLRRCADSDDPWPDAYYTG